VDTIFSTLPDDFLTHGLYLRGWSTRTVRTYRQGLATLPSTLNKSTLATWVIEARQRGLTPGGINMYARTINSYLSWLHAEGHISERLRIKLLPNPPKPLRALSDAEIRRLVMFRPTNRIARRTWTITLTMLDTGMRIDEVLSLERANVDLHGLMLRVQGKGNRERLVPISLECRRRLYLWLKPAAAPNRLASSFVFCTRTGHRLTPRNVYRDVKAMCLQAGVGGAHVYPHAFRHCFAVTYIRNGGDLYRLSRILGHASISTTQIYLRSMGIDVISEGHDRLTPLNLRRA
jgi:integrase/recombinase XerD